MVSLERIRVYPVAGLDAASVPTATLADRGGLSWDRRYAITERTPATGSDGTPVTRAREPRLRALEASYDLERETVTVSERDGDEPKTFHLELDRDCFASWLSDYVGRPVEVVRTDDGGPAVPAGPAASGPTIVGSETLETVADWYDDIDADELRRRVRPTLVVAGGPPFWEDRLYAARDRVVPVEIGPATLHGVGPKPLDAEAARDPDTGAETDGFREAFVERRRASLPDWATEARFDDYYRLSVETRVPPESRGETLSVGEELSAAAAVPAPAPAD